MCESRYGWNALSGWIKCQQAKTMSWEQQPASVATSSVFFALGYKNKKINELTELPNLDLKSVGRKSSSVLMCARPRPDFLKRI